MYMKINEINNQYNIQTFKSSFPVVHWVRESNGSFAPIATKNIVEQLQEKIIGYIGKSLLTANEAKQLQKKVKNNKKNKTYITKRLTEPMEVNAQRLRAYLSMADVDYRNSTGNMRARSFYNNAEGGVNNPYSIAYILTGNSVTDFENKYAKDIGRQLRNTNNIRAERYKELRQQYLQDISLGKKDEDIKEYYAVETAKIQKYETDGLKKARNNYNNGGLKYVNDYKRRIKDQNGKTQALHTKFEIVRNDKGEFLGYKFLDARFLPEFGPDSPFEKLGFRIC